MNRLEYALIESAVIMLYRSFFPKLSRTNASIGETLLLARMSG